MAKRKRLSPAALTGAEPDSALETAAVSGRGSVRRPPIADVSHDAAAHAAFEEVAGEFEAARSEGRLVTKLTLADVDETHLVRDRVNVDIEEMAVLRDSLRARGQQTPIEVVDLGAGRFGLISGWRRLMALRALAEEDDGEQFGFVQALIRAPESASQAYLAMVEENEIRADLSFYERARIAVQASRQGIYPSTRAAVQSLFSAARAPKRSKILSFAALVDALDDRLRFPTAIPEKLGLALVGALNEDPDFRGRISDALGKADPQDAATERAVLERHLRKPSVASEKQAPDKIAPGLQLHRAGGKVTLSGKAVDQALIDDLRQWLSQRYDAAQE